MSMPALDDGRVRRRIEAMRRVQAAALDLFERRGFAAVTVDDIARAAKVGPASVYRNFETKERVVLWDEYDPMLLDEVRARLGTGPLLGSVLDAIIASLDRVYSTDRERVLRRTRLMLAEPALVAASESDREALRGALAALFLETRVLRSEIAAEVSAAAIVATLSTAVSRWARGGGARPLRAILRDAFRALGGLACAGP